MMQTFDFLPLIWKSQELKDRLSIIIKEQTQQEIAIGVHLLTFDFALQTVKITCNNPDYPFFCKIIPAEVPMESLVCLMEHQFDGAIDYKLI